MSHQPKSMEPALLALSLLVLLAVAWACAVLGPLGYVFPFLAVGSFAYYLIRRRWFAATVYLLLLPTTISFVTGVVEYAKGKARLRYSGYPGTTFHNLDPDLRCGRVTHGCVVQGNEWLSQAPYNCAVRLLTTICGYMPGTYTGPYPSREEAISAISHGIPVGVGDLAEDRVVIGENELHLDKGVGAQLLTRSFFLNDVHDIPSWKTRPTIRAAIWREECIVLLVPFDAETKGESAMVVLLSRKNGRPFAYYGIGDYSHSFPPVSWRAQE